MKTFLYTLLSLLFLLPPSRPTENMDRYDFNDVTQGVETRSVYLTPKVASVRITLLAPDGKPMKTRAFLQELHSTPAGDIFAPTVIEVPPSGILLEFFIPIVGLNVYVGSDIVDNDRRCSLRVYGENGDYLGGDSASEPFGPVPNFPDVPPEMSPGTTDWQYMVWMMPQPLPPPYSNPLHGRPMATAKFFPDGDGVFIGRIVPYTQ